MKNPRYLTRHVTYDPSSLTSTGWLVESHATRARLTGRSRWQGSRTDEVFLVEIESPITSNAAARELADELRDLIAGGAVEVKRGSECGKFRCISAGYIVQ